MSNTIVYSLKPKALISNSQTLTNQSALWTLGITWGLVGQVKY